MKKALFAIILVIIIVGGLYLYKKPGTSSPEDTQDYTTVPRDDNTMVSDTMSDTSDSKTMSAGSYEPYAASKLAAASDGSVVLFFRASWCPTCRGLDSDIRAHLKDIPEHVTILDVNYDNSTDLKKKYGVTYQHTLVQVNADGSLIKKWSGSPTLASLVSEIKA